MTVINRKVIEGDSVHTFGCFSISSISRWSCLVLLACSTALANSSTEKGEIV